MRAFQAWQFGGASGSGFLSTPRREAANEALKAKGTFKDGMFTWVDGEGQSHSLDGASACYEEAMGRKMVLAPPPTVFTDVTNEMRIAREEVFGPILSIIGFDTEEAAVAIGNDTPYGLVAGNWTRDIGRVVRLSKALKAGTMWVNTHRFYSHMVPFGGMKLSGLGRENGIETVSEFLETKAVFLSDADLTIPSAFVLR